MSIHNCNQCGQNLEFLYSLQEVSDGDIMHFGRTIDKYYCSTCDSEVIYAANYDRLNPDKIKSWED